MRRLHLLLFALVALLFASCSSDDDYVEEVEIVGDYTYGMFVLNEGNFNAGNTEISFIDDMFTGVTNNIYRLANEGDVLGDTAQSITFYEDYAFVVVNNSHKIVVVDRHNFTFIDVIEEGINNPRYMTVVDGYGYVTNWGDPFDESDDYVAVIDLETMKVVKSVSVDFGPEKIDSNGQQVYVAHIGGYGHNNILSVIDVTSNLVAKEIEVGDNPNSLQLVDNSLWVLAGGKPDYADGGPTDGKLVKIDLGSLSVTKEFDFIGTSPSHLEFDQGLLYYTISEEDWETYETKSNIYAMELNSNTLPTESVFFTDKAFYGAVIKDGLYFGGDAKDYSSNGSVFVYDLQSGEELYVFDVGVSPSGFFFTE